TPPLPPPPRPPTFLNTYATERLPVIQMFGESSSGHTYSAVKSRWRRQLKRHVSSGSQSTLLLPGGVAGSTRLFDFFASTHHTIIIFAPSLAIPAVQSIIMTLQEVISKELAKCVVVFPGSHSEPGGHVGSRMSSGEDETIDIEVLVDQAGHAYRGYVVEEGEIKIVVVRPDGVVGAIVRGAAGLERYLEGVFGRRRVH
ncbi:hypothetical protein EDD15DRAFT_2324721, partial [Pisolithus albus]